MDLVSWQDDESVCKTGALLFSFVCGGCFFFLYLFLLTFLVQVPPEEMVKEWRTKVRGEMHAVDREIRTLERTEEKTKIEIKKLAKAGEVNSAKLLAKELVGARRAKQRMFETKARLNSIVLQLSEQLAQLRMTRAIGKSAEAMHAMNAVINVPVVAATMRELARQMEKAGFIQEIMEDTLNAGGEDLEAEANEEVDKVFEELTADIVLPSNAEKQGTKQGAGKVPAKAVKN